MNLVNFLSCTCAGVPIDDKLVGIVQLVYKAIQIGVPIILIIMGMLDMGKAITQQKEDEIKKAQSLLVKKAIAAALVFLMFSIVTLVLNVVGYNDSENCIGCLLAGKEQTTTPADDEEQTCTLTVEDCEDQEKTLNVDDCECQ